MTVTRRLLLTALPMATSALSQPAAAAETAWRFEMPSIEEGMLRFADFRGKVLLVVNTASFCGFTPQYKVLESTYRTRSPEGLVVVGIPSQDFGQETGSNGEVKAFCELTYGVEFPMSGISHVRGAEAAPFYRWVAGETKWEPRWNFFKVLIGRDGRIAGTFGSEDEPTSGRLKAAIDAALAKPAV